MIKVICDGCGKDITSYMLKYKVTIKLDDDDFKSIDRTLYICRECKDKVIGMLDKG